MVLAPSGLNLKMELVLWSETKRLPALSKARPAGPAMPATNVVLLPLGVNLIIDWLFKSPTNRLPALSKTRLRAETPLENSLLVPSGEILKIELASAS